MPLFSSSPFLLHLSLTRNASPSLLFLFFTFFFASMLRDEPNSIAAVRIWNHKETYSWNKNKKLFFLLCLVCKLLCVPVKTVLELRKMKGAMKWTGSFPHIISTSNCMWTICWLVICTQFFLSLIWRLLYLIIAKNHAILCRKNVRW